MFLKETKLVSSVTEIANSVAKKLGERAVVDWETDDTKFANSFRIRYPLIRDALLRAYVWNFAQKRVALSASATKPVWGFSNKFPLPSDYLRLVEFRDVSEFSEEDGHIHANADSVLYMLYCYKNTDVTKYDSLFVEFLATLIALELNEEITQSNTKKQLLQADLQMYKRWAISVDAKGRSSQDLPVTTWLEARA